MLVYFRKKFVLEGEYTDKVKDHFWCKSRPVRQKTHWVGHITGICDESRVRSEVERLMELALLEPGWSDLEDFSGWQRELSEEEVLLLAEEEHWPHRSCNTKVVIEYLTTWPMDKIWKTLTGEQFIQFCKENGLGVEGIKNV